jgi:hypothetical protein
LRKSQLYAVKATSEPSTSRYTHAPIDAALGEVGTDSPRTSAAMIRQARRR